MLSGSLPTLNAITARTCSAIPCLVTHCSATSASRIARVRKLAWRTNGITNAAVAGHHAERRPVPARPWRRRSASPRRARVRGSRASLSSPDVRDPPPLGSSAVAPFHHINSALAASIEHQHARSLRAAAAQTTPGTPRCRRASSPAPRPGRRRPAWRRSACRCSRPPIGRAHAWVVALSGGSDGLLGALGRVLEHGAGRGRQRRAAVARALLVVAAQPDGRG